MVCAYPYYDLPITYSKEPNWNPRNAYSYQRNITPPSSHFLDSPHYPLQGKQDFIFQNRTMEAPYFPQDWNYANKRRMWDHPSMSFEKHIPRAQTLTSRLNDYDYDRPSYNNQRRVYRLPPRIGAPTQSARMPAYSDPMYDDQEYYTDSYAPYYSLLPAMDEYKEEGEKRFSDPYQNRSQDTWDKKRERAINSRTWSRNSNDISKPPMDFTLEREEKPALRMGQLDDDTEVLPTVRVSEDRLQAVCDKLYQESQNRSKRVLNTEASQADTSFGSSKRLSKNQQKAVIERLQQRNPRYEYIDPHQPKEIKLSSGKQEEVVKRLYTIRSRSASPRLPEEFRTQYSKMDEEDMERFIDRLTKKPKRFTPPPPRKEEKKKKNEKPEWKKW